MGAAKSGPQRDIDVENAVPILKLKRIAAHLDLPVAVETVRRRCGKGQIQQAIELALLCLGWHRPSIKDYYIEGLWRPELAAGEKAAFVSEMKSKAINGRLAQIDGSGLHGMLSDKLLAGLTLRAAGFPALRPMALYGRVLRLSGTRALANASEIAAFLQEDGVLPNFGKPLHASLSIGAASFLALADGRRSIVLGDGTVVRLDVICSEIATQFSRVYVFEPLIRQHPDVEAYTGPAVGGPRVVTLRQPDDVEVLYTVQRLPGVGAMMDAMSTHSAYCVAHIDPNSGRVLGASAMDRMAPERLEASVVTGAPFSRVVVPFVKDALATALDVQRLLVRPGLLGFDFALTPDGPLLTEVNSNPFHSTYQHAADRGFLNPDFKPKIKLALDVVRRESGMS